MILNIEINNRLFCLNWQNNGGMFTSTKWDQVNNQQLGPPSLLLLFCWLILFCWCSLSPLSMMKFVSPERIILLICKRCTFFARNFIDNLALCQGGYKTTPSLVHCEIMNKKRWISLKNISINKEDANEEMAVLCMYTGRRGHSYKWNPCKPWVYSQCCKINKTLYKYIPNASA